MATWKAENIKALNLAWSFKVMDFQEFNQILQLIKFSVMAFFLSSSIA